MGAPAGLAAAALAAVLAVVVVWAVGEARKPGPWQRVFATREGLVGGRMASGEIIRPGALFVALPHRSALRRDVEIRYQGRGVVVPVLDVGPWNTDDAYWSDSQRPAAERGRGTFRKPVNPAGIDCPTRRLRRWGCATTTTSSGGSSTAATSRCRGCR